MDGPVHCITCNTTFSSQACLKDHFPCLASTFDMAKVKTEVDDSELDAGTPSKNVQVKVACNMFNLADIKAEVKSEPSDFVHESTDTNTTLTDVTYRQIGLINQGYGSAPPYRGRGKRSRGRGSRGRGRGRGSVQQMPKTLSIAPRTLNLQMPSGSFMGGSTLPNILPKVTSDKKSHEETGLKIDSVFYTRSFKRKLNVVKVADTTKANGVLSVDPRTATCSPSTAGAKTTVAVPNTFTFNSELPSLTGQNISTLPFSPFILGGNIMQTAQQDPLILGGSGPLVNPGQNVRTLQPSNFVPGLQAINLSQPLANIQNLSVPLNQNTALGVQQNIPQVFNAGTQNSSVYTSNTNQAVGSIMASGVAPTQQMSYTVPVRVGNQIVLMDLPVQYLTGVPLGNVPTSMSLPSLIQSPNPFSSTVTSSALTQHSMASAISPSQPCNSVSVNSVYPHSVQTAAPQPSIAPQQSCHQPLTANTSVAQEYAVSLKTAVPPLLLAVSSASPSQTVSTTCSANIKEEIYSRTAATKSSTFELSSALNQTTGTQTEEPSNLPGNVTTHPLHNKELSSGNSESTSISGDHSDSFVDGKVSDTLKCIISNSKPITVKSEISQSVITSSDHQSVMSTGASSGTLSAAGIPLFNSPGINVQNILPHPSVASIIQQPFISHFQTSDCAQHNSISVFNNNTVNIGSTPGFFFHNGLSMQRLDFQVQEHPGQNIWIQNITDNQPGDAGCGNNNQQIFVNSPVHETVASSQGVTHISSTPLHANKFDVSQNSSLPQHKSPENGKLLKRHIWSIKMATPDTIGKSLIKKGGKNYYSGVNILDSSENVVSLNLVESQREPKTVKEMLQTKVRINPMINNTKSWATKSSTSSALMKRSTITVRQYQKIRPNDGSLETQLRSVEVSKVSGDKPGSMQLLTNLFDTKTGLLKKHSAPTQCESDFTNTSMNNSDVSQANEDVICKIMDVKSMADVAPKPVTDHSVFLNANKSNDGKGTKGTLFVGPLTKEQLDRIIQNPSELEKYVSVPSGHILSTKALVVPAASNTVIPKESQSKVTSLETLPYSPIPLQPCPGKSESSFIKIHPKTTVQTVESPSHSGTTNTSNSTVTSVQQDGANYVTLSSLQNTPVNNVVTASVTSAERPETIDVKPVKKETSKSTSDTPTSCSWGKRKRKFLSEQRRQELKCNKDEQNQNSNIMKLSFIGDLTLLKDALRRTTVPLENLNADCDTHVVTARHFHHSPRKSVKESLKTNMSTCGDNYKQKLGKRKLLKLQQQKVSWTRHKETKIDQPAQKQWNPVEVVGDLAIRGQMSDCQTASEKTSENGGNRRSNRISAKPRLDYADLERLPFKDLDIEIEEPEYDFESFSPTQSPEPTVSLSPPVLSPAVGYIDSHPTSLFSYSHSPVVSGESLNVVTEDSAAPVLTSHSTTSRDCISPSRELKDYYYYSSESESDMYEPCAQALSKADKKKIMWKRHNEITMFLVKHAGKFHSDDENSEHYCNICHKYKTNGIFCLSHHLKRHLSGSLKCLECAYEACHEGNLAEHRKTLHSL